MKKNSYSFIAVIIHIKSRMKLYMTKKYDKQMWKLKIYDLIQPFL